MSFDPEIYDISQPGTFMGDIEWYRQRAIDAGGPVLELGAGTGRVSIPIAQAGVQITALELHAPMLEQLEKKAATLAADVRARITSVVGDMRSFALDTQFALVIIPFHSFLHNVTRADQRACLECVVKHLRPGGRLAFNIAYPSLAYMARHAGPLDGVWRWARTKDLADGRYVVYSQALRYDLPNQRVRPMIRTEFFSQDGELLRTKMLRLELAHLHPADIEQLLAGAKLELVRVWGDFKGGAPDANSAELVIEAVRPNPAQPQA